jgi:flagellar basal body-associated protein FliL
MAAAEESKSETPAASAAPSSGKGNNLVLILSAVNVLATLVMVAILFISFQHEKKVPSVQDISAKADAGGEGDKKEGKGEGGEGKEGEEGKGKEAHKKSFDFGKMVTLDQFTVNLSTPGSVNPKFARVNISLEVPTEDSEGEVTSKMPQIRNAIIDLFNSKRPADLATAEGRDYLKEEIRNALNSFLVTGKVKGVFFTNFAMSS